MKTIAFAGLAGMMTMMPGAVSAATESAHDDQGAHHQNGQTGVSYPHHPAISVKHERVLMDDEMVTATPVGAHSRAHPAINHGIDDSYHENTHSGGQTYQGRWDGEYQQDGIYRGDWEGTVHEADGRVYHGSYSGQFEGIADVERVGRHHSGDKGYDRQQLNEIEKCRKSTGIGGAVIGGAIGGLAGNRIAGRGDRLGGTLIGAGVGAVAGAAIDQATDRCRKLLKDYESGRAHGGTYDAYNDYYDRYRGWSAGYYRHHYAHYYPAYYYPMVTTITIESQPVTTTTTTTYYDDVVYAAPKAAPKKRWRAAPKKKRAKKAGPILKGCQQAEC